MANLLSSGLEKVSLNKRYIFWFWLLNLTLAEFGTAGFRRAANDHYGRGTGIAREEQAREPGRNQEQTPRRRLTPGLGMGMDDTPHGGVQWHEYEQEQELHR